MYSLIDRPVECLSQGSRFTLWAMRSWTAALSNRTCPPRTLAQSFQGMGALDALSPFHVAMSFLNRHARETIAIASVNRPRIGEGEAILLALWRDSLDPADRFRRDATLDLLVAERADTIGNALSMCATALAEADLRPDGLAHQIAEQGR